MPYILGDLKKSPSLGESSHVTFSRMAKYSSLTVSHIFRTTTKSYRGYFCISPEVYVQSGDRYKKYVLLLEYLKLIVNCSCVQKENAKQKGIIHLVDPRTFENKAAETIF